ncbi:MAG: M20/M25/M40 family metallo-hydrolase [Desulfobacterales bacterium]|nr:M20/M25/M40 family metallo-hydrolase [Desulfobacterales bacterium]
MEKIVALLSRLVEIPSTHSRPEEIDRCADFIFAWLQERGIECRRRLCNGVPTITALPAENRTPVLLMSHIDVVEAPAALFQPRQQNGRLYGRGSIDDKYAVALSMQLMHAHLEQLRAKGRAQQDMVFGLMITGDEEVGGKNGAQPTLTDMQADFAIALDGGRLDKIVIKEKGVLRLKMVSRGRAAHGARPWLGKNAIEALVADYEVLRRHFEETSPDHWHRTLNWSVVQAGQSVNQVPDRAEALFDIRFTENDDPEALVAELREQIKSEIEVLTLDPVFEAGTSSYMDLLRDVVPGAEWGVEHGASDARFLAANGIPGIVWGANGNMSQHTDDEHVELDSIGTLYRYLDRFLSLADQNR